MAVPAYRAPDVTSITEGLSIFLTEIGMFRDSRTVETAMQNFTREVVAAIQAALKKLEQNEAGSPKRLIFPFAFDKNGAFVKTSSSNITTIKKPDIADLKIIFTCYAGLRATDSSTFISFAASNSDTIKNDTIPSSEIKTLAETTLEIKTFAETTLNFFREEHAKSSAEVGKKISTTGLETDIRDTLLTADDPHEKDQTRHCCCPTCSLL